jgi:hypothetical protein
MRRELFPRIVGAYDAWRLGDRGCALSAAIAAGAEHWRELCDRILKLHTDRGADAERAIEALAGTTGIRL